MTNFYIYLDYEGNYAVKAYDKIDTDKFFYEVSKKIAFDDCTQEIVIDIFWKGSRIMYAGWQPGMKYEYKNLDGDTIWVGYFPEWDH
jgi:hypothetical protein